MVLMEYSGARGILIYEKNLKAKISCQTSFKEKNLKKTAYEKNLQHEEDLGEIDQLESTRCGNTSECIVAPR
jgi:hypothetical protein